MIDIEKLNETALNIKKHNDEILHRQSELIEIIKSQNEIISQQCNTIKSLNDELEIHSKAIKRFDYEIKFKDDIKDWQNFGTQQLHKKIKKLNEELKQQHCNLDWYYTEKEI